MHGETIFRWVNQLDGSLLKCFVHALLTTLSFMHINCGHIWKRMQNMFHSCMKMSMGFLGCLVYWIACMYVGRTAPLHTKEHTRERRSSPLWCWRQSQITTYGFGMLHLVLQVVAMTSIFLMSVHSTNSSWMVHTPKLISNLLLTNEYSTSYFIWWMEYTHN